MAKTLEMGVTREHAETWSHVAQHVRKAREDEGHGEEKCAALEQTRPQQNEGGEVTALTA